MACKGGVPWPHTSSVARSVALYQTQSAAFWHLRDSVTIITLMRCMHMLGGVTGGQADQSAAALREREQMTGSNLT